ncbi:hypothetical protein V6N13_148235 [Hibiscus sabdariffa]
MENDRSNTSPEILLVQPFLSTTNMKIEVRSGLLTMEFDGEAPQVELKDLPKHLKYAFLGYNDTLPVIVSNKLSKREEDDLVEVLRAHKEAIGWTIADIKGLSPSTCIHKIKVDEDAKPSREGQRRLNPPMMEVVKKEIQKLLDADIIYPISDSNWVSSKYQWRLKIKKNRRSRVLSEPSPIDACPSGYAIRLLRSNAAWLVFFPISSRKV